MPRYSSRSWRAYKPDAVRAEPTPRMLATRVRILGLDPGSLRTGYGIVDFIAGDCRAVTQGCIAVGGASHASRLRQIHVQIAALIEEHGPDEVAVERVFVNRNVDSALKLGQARGAALAAIPDRLATFEYAPRAVKLAVVGSGSAEKLQVAHMVRHLLQIDARLGADASDALAVAICHAHSRRLQALLQRAAVVGAR